MKKKPDLQSLPPLPKMQFTLAEKDRIAFDAINQIYTDTKCAIADLELTYTQRKAQLLQNLSQQQATVNEHAKRLLTEGGIDTDIPADQNWGYFNGVFKRKH